jgi:hypothetical protein
MLDIKKIREGLGLDIREIHPMKINSKSSSSDPFPFPDSLFDIDLKDEKHESQIVKIGENWYHIFITEYGSISRISEEEARKYIEEEPELKDGDVCPNCGGMLYEGVSPGFIVCMGCKFEQKIGDPDG